VGLNHLAVTTFPHVAPLTGCDNAAKAMAEIAEQREFSAARVLIDDKATHDAVVDWWKEANHHAVSGDLVFFSFAGHGDSVRIGRNQPAEQTMAFWNKEMADRELLEILSRFRRGVRVVIVADSCFSGGLVDLDQPTFARAMRSGGMLSALGGGASSDIESLAEKHGKAFSSRVRAFVDKRERDLTKVVADVLLIASSPKALKSPAGEEGALFSPFSDSLRQAWKAHHNGDFADGYRGLFEATKEVASKSPLASQNHPEFVDKLVKTESFVKQAPFKIEA
jgi:hypothetical protein